MIRDRLHRSYYVEGFLDGIVLAVLGFCLLLLSGCAPDPVEVTPVTQCEDLTAEMRAMRARCGYVDGPQTHYVDCKTVKAIRDPEMLETRCYPALETRCAAGDTPPEWECHQLIFTDAPVTGPN